METERFMEAMMRTGMPFPYTTIADEQTHRVIVSVITVGAVYATYTPWGV